MYTQQAIQKVLEQVSNRKISHQKAYEKLKHLSYEVLPFAKIDHHRQLRKNLPEAIYAPGKTIEQLTQIVQSSICQNAPVLVTRLEEKKFKQLKKYCPRLSYSALAQIAYLRNGVIARQHSKAKPPQNPIGFGTAQSLNRSDSRAKPKQSQRLLRRTDRPAPEDEAADRRLINRRRFAPRNDKFQKSVAIVTAGTSDIPVAEEARITLETMGRKVNVFYDLGVAGLHRLLDHIKEIESSDVVICIAGMEGALPSVLAGLISKPIIAVPTSVGYGACFKGITPLLTMLNTCAQGVSVVNIDSGFNAACFCHLLLGSSYR